jgi:protein-L-isoaspartate(D-aspartate) O-methyltransferase
VHHGRTVTSGGESQEIGEWFATARARMVSEQLVARGIRDAAVLAAMGSVPREAFVPDSQRDRAYDDTAQSIGRGQTISQPYMVARMTESLAIAAVSLSTGERPTVLDVGTGSGYQAAVLARMGARVVSIERDPELADEARERLLALGYQVEVLTGDGSLGHAARAPYAGIVVAAGAPGVPGALVEQLAGGARLVIPVGSRYSQRLTVVRRGADGDETLVGEACVFVPLVGSQGHPE